MGLIKIKRAHEGELGKLVRESAWIVGSKSLTMVIGFGVSIEVVRTYGKAGLGYLALLMSSAAVFSVVADLGIGTLLVCEIPARSQTLGKGHLRRLYLKALLIAGVFALMICT